MATFEVIERGLRLFYPSEVVRLPEELIKGESFFAELTYKAAKRC
jgi:hypothetical protein